MRRESLEGRIGKLEREARREPDLPVLRVVLPSDDHDALLAQYIAQHGREPDLTVIRHIIEPARG